VKKQLKEQKYYTRFISVPLTRKNTTGRNNAQTRKIDWEINMPGGESVKWIFCRSSLERRAKTSFSFCNDRLLYHA
jgi:hypothetical protein